jgi:hypothetical protein
MKRSVSMEIIDKCCPCSMQYPTSSLRFGWCNFEMFETSSAKSSDDWNGITILSNFLTARTWIREQVSYIEMTCLLFWLHSKAFESMHAESTSLKETQTEQSLSSQKQSIYEETGYKIACPELTPLAWCNLWFYQWCIGYIKMLLKGLLHACNRLDVIDGYDTYRLMARRKCTVGSYLWHTRRNVAAMVLSSPARMWLRSVWAEPVDGGPEQALGQGGWRLLRKWSILRYSNSHNIQ